ncbi:MAG: sigma-70 family RNA polymerase sigma factor [Fimbriimonadia bacterium]|jgi:RNA polymerase sigma-70 factor (ECF subfamily)
MTGYAMTQAYSEVSDETLARAAKAGDTASFSLLVERHRDLAFAYALARLRNPEEAEDAVQEAFVRAYRALSVFDPAMRFLPYLMRILRNHCHDLLRRRSVRQSVPLTPNLRSNAPSPEENTLREERSALILEAIGALPDHQRVPLEMHYASGCTVRQIAQALGLRESTVTGRIAGALRRLRRAVGR